MKEIEPLLEVDINALAELTESLIHCHIQTGKDDDLPAILERLRSNIKDARWQRKITYFHALCALGEDRNENACRRELRKLGSIDAEKDIEILQLYLDVFSDELSFSEKQSLIDRILSLSKSDEVKVHYKGTRAVEFLLIGDVGRARAELDEAVAIAKNQETSSEYERYRLAMSLELLGDLSDQSEMLDEAAAIYAELLSRDSLSDKGRSHLYQQLGDVHRRKEDWNTAYDMYERAHEIAPSERIRAFQIFCLLEENNIEQSISLLQTIDTRELSKHEYVDYAFALSATALRAYDPSLMDRALSILKGLDITEAIFRERRDKYLLAIIETRTKGPSQNAEKKTRGLLAGIARSASKYLLLEPNVMGLGLNINRILDNLAEGTNQHAVKSSVAQPPPIKKPNT